jgi:S-adenosylmethionine:tRNA ribosyltransferase-isomerase
MLVAAFSGLDLMKRAYAHAIAERYRFYSYGDACLLSPAPEVEDRDTDNIISLFPARRGPR